MISSLGARHSGGVTSASSGAFFVEYTAQERQWSGVLPAVTLLSS
jgi:hypothetical protein